MKIVRPVAVTDAVLVSSTIPETDYAEWNALTAYTDEQRVIVASVHRIYEAVGSSTGSNPTAVGTTKWVMVGATNKWRAFDNSIGQQSNAWSSISMTLNLNERFDTVAMFNIDAATVRVQISTPLDGSVWDVTYSLVEPLGVKDWWTYFYEPVRFRKDFYLGGLTPFSNSTVILTLDYIGYTVYCGEVVLGLSRELGFVQYGASVGIKDYSIKQVDDWGNYTVLERAYAKRADFTVWVDNIITSETAALLSLYRATPIVYVGSDLTDYSATIVYGFYKDFNVEIAYPSYSVCTLTVEGLT